VVSKPSLTKASAATAAEANGKERLEIYKMLVEMADRVSQRRQSANNFYLSVNTALVGGSAYLRTLEPNDFTVVVLSIAGMAICTLWSRNILSYKTLNEAKFAVINDIEDKLAEQPFLDEWRKLDPDGDGKRHKPFHKVEGAVPWVFAAVYLTQAASLIPWARVFQAICG
jgi:hypothetical protein